MTMKTLFLTLMLLACASSIAGKTTLTWWQFWTDPSIKPVIAEMVAEFERNNPDIKIELTDLTWSNGHEKIVIAFGSQTGPDIVELGSDWIAEFAANNLLLDMGRHIEADSADFDGWAMATYNEKVFAHPWILGTRVLFANRRLLERADYDSTFVPLTFDQLKEAARKINELGEKKYGWGSNAPEKHRLYKKYMPFFWSFGAQVYSDDGKYCLLASDSAVLALTEYKELHDKYGYVANQRGIEDAFLDGNIGFILSGDWLLKRIELENRDISFLTTLMPGRQRPGRSFLGGEFLAVNGACEHPEAAMRFVQFITSPENQIRFCRANRSANPSSVKAQQDEYFQSNIHLRTFIQQMIFAKHPPVDPDWVYMEAAIEEAVESAVFGSGLPAQSLLEARKKIENVKSR
ncbi:MAG: extracellular solute-binding protein [Candidatus Zixiibacteriota bacterium]|nr:MAG: extracellular solute-binding protein [candidate division Zixibacteria bacterium]